MADIGDVLEGYVFVSVMDYAHIWDGHLKGFRYPGRRFPVVVRVVRLSGNRIVGETWLKKTHLRVSSRHGHEWDIDTRIG